MAYDTKEAQEEAIKILAGLKKDHPEADPEDWFHLGSMESAEALGVKSLHSLTDLDHIFMGDFMSHDREYYYLRLRDTDAGRIYLRSKTTSFGKH